MTCIATKLRNSTSYHISSIHKNSAPTCNMQFCPLRLGAYSFQRSSKKGATGWVGYLVLFSPHFPSSPLISRPVSLYIFMPFPSSPPIVLSLPSLAVLLSISPLFCASGNRLACATRACTSREREGVARQRRRANTQSPLLNLSGQKLSPPTTTSEVLLKPAAIGSLLLDVSSDIPRAPFPHQPTGTPHPHQLTPCTIPLHQTPHIRLT